MFVFVAITRGWRASSCHWCCSVKTSLLAIQTVALMGTVTMVTRTATADFVNVTAQALGPNAIPGKVALGDFNNDGLVDIYSAGRLWRNTGTGFMNDPAGAPLHNDGIFGDYDKDGFLDFFPTSRANSGTTMLAAVSPTKAVSYTHLRAHETLR